MLRHRIIPVLTISGKKLVKTLRFKNPKYIGDPINAIKIFNDKEVDEIVVLDIDASVNKKAPDFKLIKEMAGESFMPLGYGGGVNSMDLAKKVFQCGVEKIVINSACFENPELISEIAAHFGSQSVVVSLDYAKRTFGKVTPRFFSAEKSLKLDLLSWAIKLENLGAGEIILQCVDRDGTFDGYDLENIKAVANTVSIPVIACGGCNSLEMINKAIEEGNASAAAVGSMFVFKNNNRDSILINYINRS